MNIRITAPIRGGEIAAIPSKSQAHRLLICAALADAPTRILCPAASEDICATAGCLRQLGAKIEYDGAGFWVTPIAQVRQGQTLHCRESGSTLRFLLPVAAALGAECSFLLKGRLPQRPHEPLLAVLKAHGCGIARPAPERIVLRGRLQGGRFIVPGSISSQFVSGLLLALPLLSGDSELLVGDTLQSRPYVDMTLQALRRFKIDIREAQQSFFIPGGAGFRTLGQLCVEGDWSSAAVWLSAGALSLESLCCKGVELSSAQGDKMIVSLLRQMGAALNAAEGGVRVAGGRLRAADIDAADIPDLVPVLAAAASLAEGTTTIYNAGRLRLKESDRLRAAARALTALGAESREEPAGLRIAGKPALTGGIVDACGDHRIAMMAAVAAVGCTGAVTVLGAQAVHKSYPAFWQHYRLLGGQAEEC